MRSTAWSLLLSQPAPAPATAKFALLFCGYLGQYVTTVLAPATSYTRPPATGQPDVAAALRWKSFGPPGVITQAPVPCVCVKWRQTPPPRLRHALQHSAAEAVRTATGEEESEDAPAPASGGPPIVLSSRCCSFSCTAANPPMNSQPPAAQRLAGVVPAAACRWACRWLRRMTAAAQPLVDDSDDEEDAWQRGEESSCAESVATSTSSLPLSEGA